MCRIIESIELLAIDINDMPWQVYDGVDWIKININVGVPTSNSSIIFKGSSDSHSYPHLPDKSSGP